MNSAGNADRDVEAATNDKKAWETPVIEVISARDAETSNTNPGDGTLTS